MQRGEVVVVFPWENRAWHVVRVHVGYCSIFTVTHMETGGREEAREALPLHTDSVQRWNTHMAALKSKSGDDMYTVEPHTQPHT